MHLEKFYRLIWGVSEVLKSTYFDKDKETCLKSPVNLAWVVEDEVGSSVAELTPH